MGVDTNGHKPGFKGAKRVLIVDFVGGDYEGAYVKLRLGVPMRKVFEYQELADANNIPGLLAVFADDILIEWNLEDEDDRPVPTTSEGMDDQDAAFGLYLWEQWTTAIQGKGDGGVGENSPLGETSPDTSTLAEHSKTTAPA